MVEGRREGGYHWNTRKLDTTSWYLRAGERGRGGCHFRAREGKEICSWKAGRWVGECCHWDARRGGGNVVTWRLDRVEGSRGLGT